MPLCTLHLLALAPSTSIKSYLSTLRATLPPSSHPITTSRPIRWIITPTHLAPETLLDPLHPNNPNPPPHNGTVFDLLLVLPTTDPLPKELLDESKVAAKFTLTVGIPSRILSSYVAHNAELLHPTDASKVPPLTGAFDKGNKNAVLTESAQNLALTPELRDWALHTYSQAPSPKAKGAVSMLNLLAFNPGAEAHASYQRYGQAFAKEVGSKHGGDAKLVGKIVQSASDSTGKGASESKDKGQGWEEVALAHYPSIVHFCEMLADPAYQGVNERHRVGSLRDTCILMTSELDEEVSGEGMAGMAGAKL